ncbi:MAG: TraR/DksA C4-type zinc finger protein [Acidobacteria bacterium]|nr:TraR/DksA C4-type zinc finger protein [Acidobacteriota bacterium]
MDETFVEEMRARLAARAAEIRQTLAHIDTATAPVSPDVAIGRLTRVDAMQSTSMRMALARDHEVELRHVERALKASDGGDYGDCRRCKEPIAQARLRARPEALLCLACATASAR